VCKVDKNVVEKLEIIKDRHPCLSLPNLGIYAVTVSERNFILNYQNTSGKNFKFLCFVDNERTVYNVIVTYLIIIISSSSSSSHSSSSSRSSYFSYLGECWMISS